MGSQHVKPPVQALVDARLKVHGIAIYRYYFSKTQREVASFCFLLGEDTELKHV